MARILFINPAWGGRVSRRGARHNRRWPPLDLLNCAALARAQGHRVALADARALPYRGEDLRRLAARADMVFLTSSPLDRWQCPNLEVERLWELARGLEHPRLVLLGAHGTLLPARSLAASRAWALVVGEPEGPVAELAAGRPRRRVRGLAYVQDGEVVFTPPARPVELEALPLPAFDLAPPHRYRYEVLGSHLALLETGRGCPFACAFCLKVMYGPGVRHKSVPRVLEEVRRVKALGARHLYFMDLEFTLRRGRTLELCAALARAGLGLEWACQCRADTVDRELLRTMREAGCRLVHFGLESGSPRMLERLGKGITPEQVIRALAEARRAGLRTACFVMFGFPGETRRDMEATLELVRRLPADLCSFHLATPYPGTRLGEDCPGLEPFCEYDAVHHRREVLAAYRRRGYRAFYGRPSRLLRLALGLGPRLCGEGARLLLGMAR